MANVRDFLYKMGLRGLDRSAVRDAEVRDIQARNNSEGTPGKRDTSDTGGYSIDRDKQIVPDDNRKPLKPTISRMPRKWERRYRKLKKLTVELIHTTKDLAYRIWELRWWREKTPQEIAAEEEMKRRKKEEAVYRKEAFLYARRISNAYARLGYCHIPPKTERSWLNNTRKVRFSHAVGEPNAIWLKIHNNLPYGVDILKLVNDEAVISNIAASCRHHIQTKYSPETGAWVCVERGRGTRGIPNQVTYRRLMELMPDREDRLTVPFGETFNSRRLYRSFRPFPHMLVGGATGNGKTNYLNMILCSLIERNSPDELQFVLVDLKNGIEFDLYEGLPHLYKDFPVAPEGIAGKNDQVIPLLRALKEEGERRLTIFKKAGVNKIEDYNRNRREGRMPRLFLIIDEWARISQSADGKAADQLLAEITATYRAAGYHVVVCTQMPKVKVVSTLIKTNLSARLAFGVPSNTESMVILDNTKAQGLQPAGRAIFKFGMTEEEVQTPLVERTTVKQIVLKAKETDGEVDKNGRLSMEDILRYSLNYLDGSLAQRPLFDHFQGKIGRNELVDLLMSFDDKIVNIDGSSYQIIPPNGGATPRKIDVYPGRIPTTGRNLR